MVLAGKGSESVTATDRVVLCGGRGLPLLLGLLLSLNFLLGVSLDDVDLLLLVLRNIVAGSVEILLLQGEETVAQDPRFEIYKPLWIKGIAFIPGLKMEVRAA